MSWIYWNRDRYRNGEDERCMGWHAGCFPVRKPECWEVLGHGEFESAEDFIVDMFGGAEHLAELRRDSSYYRNAYAEWQEKARHPMTPRGYACAPWAFGGPCEVCGETI